MESIIDIKGIFSAILSHKIIIVILTLFLLFIITQFIRKYLNKLAEKHIKRRILIKNFIPIITILLNIGAVLFILFGVLNISSEAFLAIGLSAGVAIGFASQNVLANIFGGLIIIFTRPFTIGDKITVGNYYGEVVDVSLLKIKIVTPDDSVVTIPSRSFIENSVSNTNSGELDCQVVTELMLPGTIDTSRIRDIAFEAVYSSPYVFLKKPVVILFSDVYKETSLIKMKIKAYVYDHRLEFKFSSDIYERIKLYCGSNNMIDTHFYRLPFYLKEE